MASTKFINECKNGANSNRLGKISVETIKKASGTKLELSNTLDKKISPILYGYTKQGVYSGKQLYDINDYTGSQYGLKDDEDWITLSYDNTGGTANKYINWMTLPSNNLKPNTQYAVIVEVKETTGNAYVNICGTQSNAPAQFTQTYSLQFANTTPGVYKKILTTVSNDITPVSMLRSFATFIPGASGSITFRISVLEDINASTDNFKYEPFTGLKLSPSLEYPQNVEVATGINQFDGEFELGYININTGIDTHTTTNIRTKNYQSVFPNKDYTISGEASATRWAIFYDINKKYLGYKEINTQSTGGSITTLENAYYMRWYLVNYTNVETKEQLQRGRKATEWKPYNTVEVKSETRNLYPNSNDIPVGYYAGAVKDYDNLHNGDVSLYTDRAWQGVYFNLKEIIAKNNLKIGDELTCSIYFKTNFKPTKNLRMSFYRPIGASFYEAKVFAVDEITPGEWKRVAFKFEINEYSLTSERARIETEYYDADDPYYFGNNRTNYIWFASPQIEVGDLTDYQISNESFITYNLSDNFLADEDTIDENGVLTKHINKVILNGDENWTLYSQTAEGISFMLNLPDASVGFHTSRCNRYANISQAWNSTHKNDYLIYSDHSSNKYKYFRAPNANITTVEQWKSWLSENPIIMYYKMSNSNQIQLETTGELRTYESNTIISNDANIEMEVEYSSWDTEITNSDNLTDISVEDSCYVDGQIIGTTFEKKVTSQLIAVPNDVDLIDKKIKVEIGAKYGDLSNEMIKMGNYTIERPKDEQTENFTQITAYDDFNLLDNPYVCNLDFSKDVTIADFYIDVCNQLELTPMKTAFLNSDIKVTANPFVNKETLRVVLQEIEKVSCTFSEIDYETNKIDLVWLSESEEPDYEFATNDYTTLEGGKITYGPVNCLVIKESQIEGENTVRQDDESITANGETQIAIQDSYFLFTQALREQAIDNIWNRVKGLTYVDCKLTTSYGKPFLKVGKKIRVNVNDGRVFDTYVLKHAFKYDGAFESIIESPALTKQETKVKSKSISESIRLTEIKVDKALGTITSTVKTVKELEESIQYFSVDLSQYSLIIPTDSYQKPLETKNYDINYYGYYKGKQVVPEVSISGNDNAGITTSKTDSYIRFAVDSSALIANVSNEYEITFRFIADDGTYTLVKKVNVSIAQKGENGKDGAQGPKGETGATGPQGIQGPAGANGTSTYFYVKYSANSTGNPMTNAPTSTTKYMGVASTTSTTAPTSYNAYAWSLIKGADGINGTDGAQGPAGTNGLTSYLHIKYSEDGLTFVPADEEYAEGEKPSAYIGQYVDYTEIDSTTFSDYKWYKFTENIDETLNQMKGDINANNTSINNNYQELIGKFKDYTPTSQTIQLEQSVTQLQTDTYTKTEINTKLTDGSVTKVMTASGTFDENGMHYEKTGAPTKSTINESGVNVDSSTTGEELLFAGYDKELEQTIVRTENLTVRNYLVIGNNSRIEDYEDDKGNKGGGIFIL